MAPRLSRHAATMLVLPIALTIGACSSTDPLFRDDAKLDRRAVRPADSVLPPSRDRAPSASEGSSPAPGGLSPDATLADYLRYAAANNPGLDAAFQRWRAAVERVPQVGALPDPRFTFGYFVDQPQTRVGPAEAMFGLQQTFPWFGKLADRKDAAARGAMAAWRSFEDERLALNERVTAALYELDYLDEAISITQENIELLTQFEQVIRARYRVGAAGHPELIRAQVELGRLEDRRRQLKDLRPAHVARLNSALSRPSDAPVPAAPVLPNLVADTNAAALTSLAREKNPELLSMEEKIEEQRSLTSAARQDSVPDLTVGIDYTVVGEAINPSTPGSGDDDLLLSFGVNLPLDRSKYDAAVRETVARRLAVSSERAEAANRIAADLAQAWFDHTDANRRVDLYDHTLIPKATESLEASLTAFRGGESSFLDLLETERTLLEFSLARERARTDRAVSLARMERLAGAEIATKPAESAPVGAEPEVTP